MKKTKLTISITLITLLAGCAEQQAQPVYVSPMEFKKYNCKQIAREMEYTSAQYQQMVGQNQAGELLNTALAAYMVSQRYAFTSGDNQNPQAEYLKAKYDALHQASIEKNCD